jgi:hypothetical protein
MRLEIPRRLWAPLTACLIAGAAAVVGGACLPTSSNPPTLGSGNYILVAPGNGALPGMITDSLGRKLRVLSDTIVINVSTQSYEQRAFVAITPTSGTEQAATRFVVSTRAYSMPASLTIVLPTTLYGGSIVAYATGSSSLQLQMPDHTVWRYDNR